MLSLKGRTITNTLFRQSLFNTEVKETFIKFPYNNDLSSRKKYERHTLRLFSETYVIV